MQKIAALAFVLKSELDSRIKIAAVEHHLRALASLQEGREKTAAYNELESLLKESGLWGSIASKLSGPTMQRFLLSALGLGIGGGIGGGLGYAFGAAQRNKAYRQGYGAATAQLSPMVKALYAPRGNL